MDPITTVTSTWTIAKTAGEISKKLYDFGKSLKDRELKQQIDEILDQVRELKQSASQLEDETVIFARSRASRVTITTSALRFTTRGPIPTDHFVQSALQTVLLRP